MHGDIFRFVSREHDGGIHPDSGRLYLSIELYPTIKKMRTSPLSYRTEWDSSTSS